VKFTPLQPLEIYVSHSESHRVSLKKYSSGINSTPHVFFKKDENGNVPWVVTRVCDHAKGQLRLCHDDPTKAICPMHNWEFDFKTLSYSKIPNQKFEHIVKKPIPFSIKDDLLTYQINQLNLRVPQELSAKNTRKTSVKLRFITHASVSLTMDDINFVTDPWFFGECLASGWWLKYPPKQDALDLLECANFLYISHNHPDHMHAETLKHVARDKSIIVPKFKTNSVANPLRHMGFSNIIELELLRLYRVGDSDMLISILPTGDHRDDSALFVVKGDASAVFTVDCIGANHYILPRDITFLLTNFASGASGWPLCFEVLGPLSERDKIVAKNRGNALIEVMKYIDVTRPRIYLPYAGYFDEKAPRDSMIQQHNIKNTPQQVLEKIKARFPDVTAVNPIENDCVEYQDAEIRLSTVDKPPLYITDEDYIDKYVGAQKELLKKFDIHKVADYFCQSEFRDKLILYLALTDDDYIPLDDGLKIDFFTNPVAYEVSASKTLVDQFNEIGDLAGMHHLLIKARKDSLWHIVYYGLPLEELSLGFQCRIDRKPDQHNADFWKHYTTYEVPSLKHGEERLFYKLLEGYDESGSGKNNAEDIYKKS